MNKRVYIGKSLLARFNSGESVDVDNIAIIDIAEGLFIMDKTEGCVELIAKT